MIIECKKCFRHHFAVTLEYAECEVTHFNQYYNTLSREQQVENYGGNPSSIERYKTCTRCGHDEFQEPTKKLNAGSTINPIIFVVD